MTEISNELPEVARIEERGGWNFTIALHVEFQNTQYELIKAFDQAKLKFPAHLMETWNSRLEKEVAVVKTVKESAFVAKLTQLDKERDKMLTSIFAIVRGNKLSHKQATAEAATRLMRLLKPYSSTQRAYLDEETANIHSLKEDMSTQAADIATLDLTDAFAELFSLNDAFEELRIQRHTETPSGDLPNAREARTETSEAYDVVCCYIEAAFLHADSDEDRAAIRALINNLNKVTAAFKTTHNMKVGHRKKAESEELKVKS